MICQLYLKDRLPISTPIHMNQFTMQARAQVRSQGISILLRSGLLIALLWGINCSSGEELETEVPDESVQADALHPIPRQGAMNYDESGQDSDSEDTTTTILLAGDIHFDWGVSIVQAAQGDTWPVEPVADWFHEADYRIVNLETSLTDEGEAFPEKSYIFNSEPDRVEVLKYLGVNLAVLGNNHSMDMGYPGLVRTVDVLRRSGVASVGAGSNEAAARAPFYFRLEDQSFAVISYSAIGENEIFGSSTRPGVARYNYAVLQQQIRRVARQVDVVIVSLHWGYEYYPEPERVQVQQARGMIDAGATIIYGHHPHIPQGIEIYKDGVILYSLGNFLFGSVNEQQDHNIVVRIDLDREESKVHQVHVHPIFGKYREETNIARPLSAEESADFWPMFYLQCQRLSSQSVEMLHILENGSGVFKLEND